MEALDNTAAYTSYSASAFDTTCSFYEAQLGCTPAFAWDRADSRGVYYNLGQAPIAEVIDATRGEEALSPPPPGSFSIVVIVDDAVRTRDEMGARGVTVTAPLVNEPWGRYFGVQDPDAVMLYFLERRSQRPS
jgi:predicted enzyme related to lactoylglutathione lyase